MTKLIKRLRTLIRPTPHLLISEWCDRNLYLPAEGNAEPGKYHLSRLPYQRAMLDDLCDPTVSEVVWQIASQLGKTACMIGGICYYIDHEPTSMLVVYPTLDSAKAWAREKLNPTIEATPILKGRIRDPRARDSENTTLNKKFSGGNLTACGANSPSGLRQRSKRVVLQDEIDAFQANSEGDPVEQADGRARNFHNAVKLKSSTVTIKGVSQIEKKMAGTDRQQWFVKCPKCRKPQILRWPQFRFEDRDNPYYQCEDDACQHHWTDAERIAAILDGEWKATAPFTGARGRMMNGLYRIMGKKDFYPTYYHEFLDEFLKAKAKGRLALMVWTNIFLNEAWEDEADRIESSELAKRCEKYGPTLPAKCLILTAGVDVQTNRIELEVDAWGADEESWAVEYIVIPGNPLQPAIWRELDKVWQRTWKTEDGRSLTIQAACVDTGGTSGMTKGAYAYLRTSYSRRIYACKGSSVAGDPIIGRASWNYRARVRLYMIGTDIAKSTIYSRLKQTEHGPGYMHYPVGYGFTDEYFQMLTAEECRTAYKKGFPVREWHATRPRNEALDCRVYSLAAMTILAPNWIQLTKRVEKQTKAIEIATNAETVAPNSEAQPEQPGAAEKPHRRKRIRTSLIRW